MGVMCAYLDVSDNRRADKFCIDNSKNLIIQKIIAFNSSYEF